MATQQGERSVEAPMVDEEGVQDLRTIGNLEGGQQPRELSCRCSCLQHGAARPKRHGGGDECRLRDLPQCEWI